MEGEGRVEVGRDVAGPAGEGAAIGRGLTICSGERGAPVTRRRHGGGSPAAPNANPRTGAYAAGIPGRDRRGGRTTVTHNLTRTTTRTPSLIPTSARGLAGKKVAGVGELPLMAGLLFLFTGTTLVGCYKLRPWTWCHGDGPGARWCAGEEEPR